MTLYSDTLALAESTDSVTSSDSTDSESSSETFSPQDHMKMMQGGMSGMRPMGPPPEGMGSPGLPPEIDTDSDGTLSEDEYENLVSQLGEQNSLSTEDFFAKFDTDGDGEITGSEMEAVQSSETSDTAPIGPPPPPPSGDFI
ncbi:EF-hand domain-containing protein [Candidatus Parcubacteria bacterium]|nr:MAG: EF-hand domain-containing protein [Candidatus Parcubacteria bacterium]